MQRKNIVVIATQPWDISIGSNCRNIALELAKKNQVLYVNAPVDRNILITKRSEEWVKKRKAVINRERSSLEKVHSNIWTLYPDFVAESVNSIPVPFVHDFMNKRNNLKFARAIKKAIEEIHFDDFVIFNDSMMLRGFYLKEMLQPSLHIYYIRDYLISQPYFKKHGLRLEKELIAKSDVVVTNSLFLRDYACQFNRNSHYVGQGCEFDVFNSEINWPKPEELAGIKTPVIGYIGFLTAMRLDIELIEYIATNRREWTIVLVGPEDEAFRKSKLHKLKNVVFTGKKKPNELAAYVQHFDVCINPQKVNDLTIGNYPRKIDEYLAMGKPTVATATKAMEVFRDYCFLANNPGEFVLMAEWALAGKTTVTEAQRIEFARSHTWENNVREMCEVIEGNVPVSSQRVPAEDVF